MWHSLRDFQYDQTYVRKARLSVLSVMWNSSGYTWKELENNVYTVNMFIIQ